MKKYNYFQKSKWKNCAILTVVAMLLTITNLNVYSFIGNYTMSSSAIMTMNEREFSHSIEEPNALFFASVRSYGICLLDFLGSKRALCCVSRVAASAAAAALFRPNDQLIEKMSLFNDNDYSKYDFSEFDN